MEKASEHVRQNELRFDCPTYFMKFPFFYVCTQKKKKNGFFCCCNFYLTSRLLNYIIIIIIMTIACVAQRTYEKT